MEVTQSRRFFAALLFMQAVMVVFDAFSTLQSSPWTAENVGADDEKAASAREYVRHAVVVSMGYTIVSTIIAGSPVPFMGGASANIYLIWLYDRAIKRAQASGSDNWNRPMNQEAA
jgi:hypothetical protein